MNKKTGTILNLWQLHNLDVPEEKLRELRPDVKVDKALILSGTVVEDGTGRWQPGFHMRSSLVIDVDRENGIIETENTIYQVQGEEGDPVTGGDVGRAVLSIFY